MHDLKPVTALGGTAPRVETIGTLTIAENADVALASVAARTGKEAACRKMIKTLIKGDAPGPARAHLNDPISGFWMGPGQWMLAAPISTHEDLTDQLKIKLKSNASVTEQSGAWVVFDVTGVAMPDLCERICAVPIRQMQAGDAQRTVIHQLGCFVIRGAADNHIRILGPRASAGTLHHALIAAAKSAL